MARGAAVAISFLILSRPLFISTYFSVLEGALGVLVLALLTYIAVPDRRRVIPIPIPLVLFVLWTGTTSLWAYFGWSSRSDVLGLIAIAVAAFYFAAALDLNDIVIGVLFATLFILLVSVIVAVAAPHLGLVTGVNYEDGTLRGVYDQRNALAHTLMLGIPSALLAKFGRSRGVEIALRVVFSCALFAAILWSVSVTSILVTIGVGVVALILLLLRWLTSNRRMIALSGVSAVLAAGVIIVLSQQNAIFAILGRNPDLTGRTTIWAAVTPIIQRNPFGVGWNWDWAQRAPFAREVAKFTHFQVGHAHSEFYNWLLVVGWPGVILIELTILLTLVAAVALFWRRLEAQHLWLVLILAATIGRDTVEVSESKPHGWFLLVLVIAIALFTIQERWPNRLPRWLVFPVDFGSRERVSHMESTHSEPVPKSTSRSADVSARG
jgi:exopolysaccharide production protein ExoQ